ncbi:phosphoesterase [Caulobacter sp. 602-2]|uniref:Phosphoesterase n=1 Tax=Caulobacter sp. 602-2 TaxID=2710887 RepID=A0A6G4R125_9CAUL|nr:alkaline phosphatase family protein [Caulobacter sp. 602-2]NGM51417.1 phosphoesterase [Caulobacter sp. 602-2]
MSTPQTAQVQITNGTANPAIVTLWHKNSDYGTESQTFLLLEHATSAPMTVHFNTGWGSLSVLDYWAVKLVVVNGTHSGVYHNTGSGWWTECQLQSADAGKLITLTVDTGAFTVPLPSGGVSVPMQKVAPYTTVDNVFVLMLENHSFDNIFAMSGIPGIQHATSANTNTYVDGTGQSHTYAVGSQAPQAMPTDPGHEFADVLEQLCGVGTTRDPWTPYNQPITNSGFAANYATSKSEAPTFGPDLPTASQIGDIMQCFDTKNALPVIYALATEFAICDRWHSSLPGPTWPNRFFVHGASSAGWTDSPGPLTIGDWVGHSGFVYPSGASVFDRMDAAGLPWRIYADHTGDVAGAVPQVASLKGITYKLDTESFSSLASDVLGPYPYAYTFIEPNYGDVVFGTYKGGSSQHPMDSMTNGEALIKATYEAIRNSPLWNRSLLIITYDEHGGFYDSVAPGEAPKPGDGSPENLSINSGGFLFDQYGVRVPAVVVSPQIARNTVSHTLYDHASVPATLASLYGFPHMTARDASANTVLDVFNVYPPRGDCPTILPNPVAAPTPAPAAAVRDPSAPLPEGGNAQALLQTLAKTQIDLARGDPAEAAAIRAHVATIKTSGELEAYAIQVQAMAAQAVAASSPDDPTGPNIPRSTLIGPASPQ